MPTAITALTELGELAFLAATSGAPAGRPLFSGIAVNDPFLNALQQWWSTEASQTTQYQSVISLLSADPDLAVFQPEEGQPGPLILLPGGGGSQRSFAEIVSSLFIGAAQRMYYMRAELSSPSFVSAVLENYEETLKAGRGEPVRVYRILGYSGISLEDTAQVQTPYGIIRAAPATLYTMSTHTFVHATAVLTTPRVVSLVISNDGQPPAPTIDQEWFELVQRARNYLPLAFALATMDSERCAPVLVFESAILPMHSSNWFSLPSMYLKPQPHVSPDRAEIKAAEDWCHRLEYDHDNSLQVAERRVVSAISERFDQADSLIDALIAWESIVGTRTETTFRVTAALARLLEPDASKRREFRRTLANVYDTRSRVVHGDVVDQAAIQGAAEEGIVVALETLKELYSRSADWRTAKSGDRADRIVLET